MTSGTLARADGSLAGIDVSLPQRIRAGGTASATVELWGGGSDEVVDGLTAVFGYGPSGPADRLVTLARRPITDTFTIHAADHRVLGTTVEVPPGLPVSRGNTRVRFGLRLTTAESGAAPESEKRKPANRPGETRVPATDGGTASSPSAGPPKLDATQPVEVRPGDRLGHVLDAVSALGFFLVAADPIAPGSVPSGTGPDASDPAQQAGPRQQLRFRPRWGPYEEAGDLFVHPVHRDSRLEVGLAVRATGERHPNGGGAVEPTGYLDVRDTDRQTVRDDLRRLLEELTGG